MFDIETQWFRYGFWNLSEPSKIMIQRHDPMYPIVDLSKQDVKRVQTMIEPYLIEKEFDASLPSVIDIVCKFLQTMSRFLYDYIMGEDNCKSAKESALVYLKKKCVLSIPDLVRCSLLVHREPDHLNRSDISLLLNKFIWHEGKRQCAICTIPWSFRSLNAHQNYLYDDEEIRITRRDKGVSKQELFFPTRLSKSEVYTIWIKSFEGASFHGMSVNLCIIRRYLMNKVKNVLKKEIVNLVWHGDTEDIRHIHFTCYVDATIIPIHTLTGKCNFNAICIDVIIKMLNLLYRIWRSRQFNGKLRYLNQPDIMHPLVETLYGISQLDDEEARNITYCALEWFLMMNYDLGLYQCIVKELDTKEWLLKEESQVMSYEYIWQIWLKWSSYIEFDVHILKLIRSSFIPGVSMNNVYVSERTNALRSKRDDYRSTKVKTLVLDDVCGSNKFWSDVVLRLRNRYGKREPVIEIKVKNVMSHVGSTTEFKDWMAKYNIDVFASEYDMGIVYENLGFVRRIVEKR
jgi:hypothetical protein